MFFGSQQQQERRGRNLEGGQSKRIARSAACLLGKQAYTVTGRQLQWLKCHWSSRMPRPKRKYIIASLVGAALALMQLYARAWWIGSDYASFMPYWMPGKLVEQDTTSLQSQWVSLFIDKSFVDEGLFRAFIGGWLGVSVILAWDTIRKYYLRED
jgi:hypothetical protein